MGLMQAVLLSAASFNVVSSSPAPIPSLTPSIVPLETPQNKIPVPGTAAGAGSPVFKSFLSYSIELAFLPDFAGNKANPNTFSDTLLNNLKDFQGSKPNLRVGGNTQDYALFDSSLNTATEGTYIPSISNDYPRILSIGPLFFESYQALPDVQFIHGFNLAKNDTVAANSITASVPYACDALSKSSLLFWEMGNEPDLYKTSAQGIMRPSTWNEADYVKEWNTKVEDVKSSLKQACSADWVDTQNFKWIAPSFAGTNNSLKAVAAWKAGLDASESIALFASHNYISGATSPGVTLAGTLMNHTKTVASIAAHNAEHKAIIDAGMNLDYILGETNSLYNQGAPGLSNSFGAALWNVDFALQCAATNIKQIYMHMGTDYRYASWQPITSSKTTIGTKPPYYGNIATAAALGDITNATTQVQNIPLRNEHEAAYSIYTSDKLTRLMIINMNQYNYTVPEPSIRPEIGYNFTVPTTCAGSGLVQRLLANGSDATTGITFNGITYDYEVAKGKPQSVAGVNKNEIVWVGEDGSFTVWVPSSSAALVQLTC